MKKRITVLGSTGSIGTQTLEVIGSHPENFELTEHLKKYAIDKNIDPEKIDELLANPATS